MIYSRTWDDKCTGDIPFWTLHAIKKWQRKRSKDTNWHLMVIIRPDAKWKRVIKLTRASTQNSCYNMLQKLPNLTNFWWTPSNWDQSMLLLQQNESETSSMTLTSFLTLGIARFSAFFIPRVVSSRIDVCYRNFQIVTGYISPY